MLTSSVGFTSLYYQNTNGSDGRHCTSLITRRLHSSVRYFLS